MNRRPVGALPSSKTLSRRAQDLGKDFWKGYQELRKQYRMKGLTPREAVERTAKEMQLMDKWQDWKMRREFSEATGRDVAATNEEVREAYPNFRSPLEVTAEEVGDREMSFAEEVLWARDQHAMVKGGGVAPRIFPSKGALSWYQYSLTNHEKFMQQVAAVSKPQLSGDDAYMRDGEYRFKEIEEQVKDALVEVGNRLVEMEAGFATQFLTAKGE